METLARLLDSDYLDVKTPTSHSLTPKMITSLRLKFGRAAGAPSQDLAVTPVTVFVGPNNSGKSKILAEIQHYCNSGERDATAVILEDLTFDEMSVETANSAIDRIALKPNPGEALNVNHILVGGRGDRMQVPSEALRDVLKQPETNLRAFCQWYLKYSTLMLDGHNRISLVNPQSAGDLQQQPQSSFQLLFHDDARRHEVRRIVAEAFGLYFVIDPTNLGQLRIRLASRAPVSDLEERGIHDEAVKFQAAAQPIEIASDGVKAFTGIVTEVMAGDFRVVLIDEPEAFLHPALASKLGAELARAAIASDKRVFVSTHSPTFIMGCIQSGVPVDIVRLTYRSGVATARVLPSADILKLMRNPLLRSTGVLSGLFYEFVVVTESDADRAFYQEVNERLLRIKPEWGIPNCLFINAQNKQTVHTIVRPLRELGIPTAGIVDIDVVKEGGTVWASLLSGAFIPPMSHHALAALRTSVKQAMDASGRDMKRDGGTAVLSADEREAAENLLQQLADYGVFVVPGGELESWLKPLGASRHGPAWLIDIFERMGEDPDHVSYVRPSEDDVWEFIGKLKAWMVNPARKGIPG